MSDCSCRKHGVCPACIRPGTLGEDRSVPERLSRVEHDVRVLEDVFIQAVRLEANRSGLVSRAMLDTAIDRRSSDVLELAALRGLW